MRQFGDDYIEEGILVVDLDAEGQGTKAADAKFKISPLRSIRSNRISPSRSSPLFANLKRGRTAPY